MKFKFYFMLLMVFSFHLSYGQAKDGENTKTSDCSNYNAFRTSNSKESLIYYTESISPTGMIMFDLSKSDEFTGIVGLYPLLGVESGSTFTLVKTTASRFDKDKKFYKYQQYYQGIKVNGGGYTESAIGDGPNDPCSKSYSLLPNIHSGINVSITPTFPSSSLGTILQSQDGIQSELLISLNELGDCQYHLVWKAIYNRNGNKISYVDAHTGAILNTYENDAFILAPTANYGTVILDDTFTDGKYRLESPDGRVRTYESCPISHGGFWEQDIPRTPSNPWTTADASLGTFQSHFVANEVLPAFDGLGIVFESVDIAFCSSYTNNAKAFNDEDVSTVKAFVKIGETSSGSRPLATVDAVAHEMAHCYLYDFFPYNSNGNKALHEGISDIIATSVESQVQGFIDWTMGDDDPEVRDLVGRNLSLPSNSCITNVENAASSHIRGKPLSHWFYLISNGDGQSITALGITKATNIMLEALNGLSGNNLDYDDFGTAVLDIVNNEYGPCSTEGIAVRLAFQAICLSTTDICSFNIVGPEEVCEEDDELQMCISGGAPGVTYRWYFPLGWTVQGSSNGNYVEGNCLTVTDFPKYNWYPKYFKITVKLLGTGTERSKNIRLKDCLGDDPTCEEYNSLNDGGSSERSNEHDDVSLESPEIRTIKVFDITGRLLYTGEIEGLNLKSYSGIIILSYFDKNGKFLKAEKKFLSK